MKYEYLTFDCYGTLIDWKTGIISSVEKVVGRLPSPPTELMNAYLLAEKREEGQYRKYREVLKRTFESLMGEMKLSLPGESSSRFAGSVPEWPAFNDTESSLRRLGERGYRRYILSNVDNDVLQETIRRNGLQVDGTVTAEEVGSYKPSPGHWTRFFEKTGAKKQVVLHVAQSMYHDIIPAKQLGISSAWVNRYDEPLPAGAEPTFISDSLENLVRMLG